MATKVNPIGGITALFSSASPRPLYDGYNIIVMVREIAIKPLHYQKVEHCHLEGLTLLYRPIRTVTMTTHLLGGLIVLDSLGEADSNMPWGPLATVILQMIPIRMTKRNSSTEPNRYIRVMQHVMCGSHPETHLV